MKRAHGAPYIIGEIILEMTETGIVEGTLYVLGGFSLLTWSVIVLKVGEVVLSDLRNHFFVRRLKTGKQLAFTNPAKSRAPAERVWQAGQAKLIKAGDLPDLNSGRHEAWYELIESAMRQQIRKERTRLDSGLGWLASIGSTAPFIGLFGTVRGIMHALKDISAQGSASLDVGGRADRRSVDRYGSRDCGRDSGGDRLQLLSESKPPDRNKPWNMLRATSCIPQSKTI